MRTDDVATRVEGATGIAAHSAQARETPFAVRSRLTVIIDRTGARAQPVRPLDLTRRTRSIALRAARAVRRIGIERLGDVARQQKRDRKDPCHGFDGTSGRSRASSTASAQIQVPSTGRQALCDPMIRGHGSGSQQGTAQIPATQVSPSAPG